MAIFGNCWLADEIEADFGASVLIHDVDTHAATLPEVADLAQTGFSPNIASAVVIDPTHVRVFFARPALRNSALSNPDNYEITPPLTVYAAVPDMLNFDPLYVDLTIDEQHTGTLYYLVFNRIEAA